MAEIEFRAVAKNGLKVTTIGLGGTGLGNMYRAVDTDTAVKAVHAAYDNGIRYFDTAPVYGFGVSETRLGLAIKSLPRADIVISPRSATTSFRSLPRIFSRRCGTSPVHSSPNSTIRAMP
jgi:D-threo-aldose 1-dehydrogenase